MAFISVTFGYEQKKMFNINCEIAPLLDAINTEAYKEMRNKLTQREDFFNKEIKQFEKDKETFEKKLAKLEAPPPEPKKEPTEKKARGGKKKTKAEIQAEKEAEEKRLEEERLQKEKEEEEKRLAEEAERIRKEEEEAAKNKKGGKDKGKKGAAEEAPVEEVAETPEQKKEREIGEVKAQIEELTLKIQAYTDKIKCAQDERANQEPEEKRKKELDLVEKASGERKFLKAGSREFANSVLGERRCYQFVEVKAPAEEGAEEDLKPISMNGAAIRTPAEDITWEEQQKELEANAPKGGKAPPKGKKK
jgi:hypothetical protein